MKYSIAATALSLAVAASAKKCQNLTIPIVASARNGVFDISAPANDIETANFFLDLSQQGANYTASVLKGYTTVSGNYEIAATYCEPDSGPSSALQILTHGIGFDRSYWDLSFNNYNYSYVSEAVDQYGFSTFAYDRLGIGMSSHGEPVNEIQALLEVDALKELTLMIKAGKISGIPKSFEKISHAGHSYGSQHTYALTAMYPDISDCMTLTGFSQNGSFAVDFLLGGDFIEANSYSALSDYPVGYFAPADATAVQLLFFGPGDFDPAVLALAYATGEPVTAGELLTFGGETGSINHFAGPTHIVTGNRDIPYCGGNCLAAPTGYSSVPATSKNFLPNAKDFTVDIIPGAGHGLNLEYSHVISYPTILNYLVQNGCGPKGGKSSSSGSWPSQ